MGYFSRRALKELIELNKIPIGKAAHTTAYIMLACLAVTIFLGILIFGWYPINSDMPIYFFVVVAIISIIFIGVYLFSNDTPMLAAITILMGYATILPIMLFFIIRLSVIIFGNEYNYSFMLTSQTVYWQTWKSTENDMVIQYRINYERDKIYDKIGTEITLTAKKGVFNIILISPNELKKIKK